MRPQKGQNNLLQGHGKNQLEAESTSVIPNPSHHTGNEDFKAGH